MRYAVLTSGSCGNCYAFSDGERTILVDDGLTLSGLRRRLEDVQIPVDSVSDVYVTHMHPDHSKGLGVLYRRLGARVHASRQCMDSDECIFNRLGLGREDVDVFDFGDTLVSGDFTLSPFRTSHDSAGSAGYHIATPSVSFFLMTDTGLFSEESISLARGCDVLFVESNYDETMLENGGYPSFLKRRIDGPRGHMSNSQARDFLSRAEALDRKVFLIHLSENNNSVEAVGRLYEGLDDVTVCERGRTYGGYDV